MKKNKRRSHCPISFALDTFGDKWTLLVMRDIMFKGKSYYGEFLQSEEMIATNILASRLSLLEQRRIITKQHDPNNRSRFIYQLTDKGLALLPTLIEIVIWSSNYDRDTAADKEFVAMAKQNRKKLIAGITARLREKMKK